MAHKGFPLKQLVTEYIQKEKQVDITRPLPQNVIDEIRKFVKTLKVLKVLLLYLYFNSIFFKMKYEMSFLSRIYYLVNIHQLALNWQVSCHHQHIC